MKTTAIAVKGIPQETRDHFKAWCAQHATTMTAELIRYIEQRAQEHKQGNKG